MFCQQCGKHLPDDALFCLQCGTRIVRTANDVSENKQKEVRPREGWRRSIITVVIILIVAIVALRLAALWPRFPRSSTPRNESALTPIHYLTAPTPQPTPYWATKSIALGREAIALTPEQYWHWQIDVKDEWRNARLVGKFKAQGGSGNDVEAFVTDDDGLINFKNNHRYKIWYKSGRVTVDTINAPLPSGRSYFVLSNTFSMFAHKSVTFNLKVEYEHLVQP